jgi:DNA-3-methyladenine glycosylase
MVDMPVKCNPKQPFPQGILRGDTAAAARALLGAIIVRDLDGERLAGRIVEVEAYLGSMDAACHSFKGETARNAVMFGPAGRAYVYFIYGFHHCLNVVTRPEGVPEAVLIRALEPLEGLERMRENRKGRDNLASGPGVLCQAMEIDRAYNGHDLRRPPLRLLRGKPIPDEEVGISQRIGVAYAGEAAQWPLRFYIKGSPFVSGRNRS